MGVGDEAGPLAEAVGVLEQVISRMVEVLEHQGRMLRELLEASSLTPKEEARLTERTARSSCPSNQPWRTSARRWATKSSG